MKRGFFALKELWIDFNLKNVTSNGICWFKTDARHIPVGQLDPNMRPELA